MHDLCTCLRTISLDVGAKGDLLHFELTTPGGSSLFKIHVNADGKVEIFAADGVDVFNGKNQNEKVLGNQNVNIKKNETRLVEGNQEETLRGDRKTSVSGSDTHTVGNDLTQNVQRNQIVTIGGKLEEKVSGGNVLLMKPGDLARETTLNAGWKIDIGDPLSGANPVALAGLEVSTFTGDIKHSVTVKGDVLSDTILGDVGMSTLKGDANFETLVGTAKLSGTDVQLGGSMGKEPFVCGNMMMEMFGALVDAVMNMTVPTPMGPSGPTIDQKAALLALKAKVTANYPLSLFITGQKVYSPF